MTRICPLLALGALLATAPSALATTPVVETLGVEGGTVAGREGIFVVRAADPAAPVAGLVLSFEGEQFGSSACRAEGPDSRRVQAPFAAGSPVVLSAPHRFGGAGTSEGVARVDSGGCARPTGSVVQPFTATVTEPGQPTQPLVLGAPVPLPELPLEVPEIPGLPGLPPLSPLDDPLGALPAAQPCRGARSAIGRSTASRRRARTAVHCLLNRERQRRGLRPLGEDARLLEAAGAHSRAMVRGGFFSHFGTTPPGQTLVDRLRRSHYLPARRYVVGENLAYGRGGRSSPASILRAWMRSTSHRANILAPSFREVGIGIEVGSPVAPNRGVTYTTAFGRRR